MRTVQTTLYTYDELSDAAKERAREWFRQGNFDFDWWADVYIDAKDIGGMLGFSDMDISFSGFWSQGDGASFTGQWHAKDVKPGAVKAYAPKDDKLKAIAAKLEALAAESPDASIRLYRLSHQYAHRYTIGFDAVERRIGFEEIPDDYITRFKSAAYDLMGWIYRQLEQEYEYLTSDESIAEAIKAGAFEFTAYGDMPKL